MRTRRKVENMGVLALPTFSAPPSPGSAGSPAIFPLLHVAAGPRGQIDSYEGPQPQPFFFFPAPTLPVSVLKEDIAANRYAMPRAARMVRLRC